jgi:2'-5' RNA ligase
MRVFIALNLPKDIKSFLFNLGREIRGRYPFIKPVPEGNLHITLRFLGEISEEKCEILKENLKDLGKSFPLKLSKVGGFPTEMGARVIWVGFEESKELVELSLKVDTIVDSLGFPKRDKPFVPHITLARTEKPVNVESFKVKNLTFFAKEVVIYQSILAKPNAIYKSLKVIHLEGD